MTYSSAYALSPGRGYAFNSGLAEEEALQSRCVKAWQHAQLRCAPATIKFRVNLTPINAERQPSPLGEGMLLIRGWRRKKPYSLNVSKPGNTHSFAVRQPRLSLE
jgi:hypothetical protein